MKQATFATVGLLAGLLATHVAAAVCEANSAAPPIVVELYTSEGCSSCPPADRWLSTLKARPDVLALAFHVDYWNRLGWADRFAAPEFTARQRERVRQLGGPYVYTPQVIVDGRDWRQWPRLPEAAAAAPSQVPRLRLSRQGEQVTAVVEAAPTAVAGSRLSGYWAVLEDGHLSRVSAGENAGETLRHDHVVRLLRPLPPWAAAEGLHTQLTASRGDPAYPRRVVLVVTDAASQRPLQALALAC